VVGRPALRRRRLLQVGAASALGLAGCGSGDDAQPAPAAERRGGESTQADVAVLRGVLEMHDRALAACAGVPGELGRALVAHERNHVDAVLRAISERRGIPGERVAVAPAVPARAAVEAALRVQEQAVAMQSDALAKLSEGALREKVAALLAADAEAAAALRVTLGRDPAPAAFSLGRRP
jgi:hypothetical protein